MSPHQPEKLLVLLFVVAVSITYILTGADPKELQAAPSYQISPPPNVRLSTKSVDKSVATVGDVLTYTVVIDKRGGPNQQQTVMIDRLRPEIAFAGTLTYTGVASFFWYSAYDHALAWGAIYPAGPVTTTLTWQVEITSVPPGGILTNSAWIFSDQQLVTREAFTFIQTPTPTNTPTPTDTPTPTNTPTPTATATPTNTPTANPTVTLRPTMTPRPTATPDPGVTVTPTVTHPANWPKYLPETGER